MRILTVFPIVRIRPKLQYIDLLSNPACCTTNAQEIEVSGVCAEFPCSAQVGYTCVQRVRGDSAAATPQMPRTVVSCRCAIYSIRLIKIRLYCRTYLTRHMGQTPMSGGPVLQVRLGRQFRGKRVTIPLVARLRVPNAVALAYAACAVLILGGSTCALMMFFC